MPGWLEAILVGLAVAVLVPVVCGVLLAFITGPEERAKHLSEEPWKDWDGEVPPEVEREDG